jgi:hypothetical protein
MSAKPEKRVWTPSVGTSVTLAVALVGGTFGALLAYGHYDELNGLAKSTGLFDDDTRSYTYENPIKTEPYTEIKHTSGGDTLRTLGIVGVTAAIWLGITLRRKVLKLRPINEE